MKRPSDETEVPIIDVAKVMKDNSNNVKFFADMLSRLDLNPHMENIGKAVAKGDAVAYEQYAHAIKGNVAWVAAQRLHVIAKRIMTAFPDFPAMVSAYPNLVEAVIEYKHHSVKVQLQMGGKIKGKKSSNFLVASPFRIEHCIEDDYYYCLAKNQSGKYLRK